MAEVKKKLSSFTIGAHVKVWVDINIKAESLEDAVAKSKALEVSDFVKVLGSWIDTIDYKVVSVYTNDD